VNEATAFAELVGGLKARDPASVEALCRKYTPFIRAVVRRQLHPRMRTRFDSVDFVQDVWASFLAIPAEKYNFDTPQALHAFITRIAYNRVVEVFRQRFETQKEDISRETTPNDDDGRDQVPSRAPTASQFAIAGEEWERIRSRFPAGHQKILEWLREGYTNDDVARLAKVSLSTVNRIVRRLKNLTGL